MTTFIKLATVLLFSNIALEQSSYALVSAEVGGGQRSTAVKYDLTNETGKTKKISGQEVFANVMIDPIPLVPFSFGLALSSSSEDRATLAKEILEDQGSESTSTTLDVSSKVARLLYGPILKIWAPIPFVKPYLKFAYLMGQEVETTKNSADYTYSSTVYNYNIAGKATYDVTGTELAVGLGYSPIKLFNIFFEYGMFSGSTKIKSMSLESTTVNGSETSTDTLDTSSLSDEEKKAKTSTAASVRLGFSLGI